jgi:nucleoside-diphosphate-sugar epimerase
MRCLVLGISGFLGKSVAKRLLSCGNEVTGACRETQNAPNWLPVVMCDLHNNADTRALLSQGWDEVYQFAGDVGGTIRADRYDYMMNNISININVIKNLKCVKKVFFPSSAWVYQEDRTFYLEELVNPINPSNLYGWEKLIGELLYETTKKAVIGRIHNVYGVGSPFHGEKALAPAAFCYQVLTQDKVKIYGDGTQERSFLYIDDFVDCLMMLMKKDFCSPVNIGSQTPVTIRKLCETIINISGKKVEIEYGKEPVDVKTRVSYNNMVEHMTGGWKPKVGFDDGILKTFEYVKRNIAI